MNDSIDKHDVTKYPIFNGQTFDVPKEKKSHTVVCIRNPQKYNYLHIDETGQNRTVIIRPSEGNKQHRLYIPDEKTTFSKRQFEQGKSQEFWTIRPKNNIPFTLNLDYSKGTIPMTLPDVFFEGNEPMRIITSHWNMRKAEQQQGNKPFVMPAVDMLKHNVEEPLVMTEISEATMKKAGFKVGENSLDLKKNDSGSKYDLDDFIKSLLTNTGGAVGQVVDNYALLKDFFPNGKFYIKEVKGKYYIIFKCLAGHRQEFRGVKYALNNPKMISLSIAKRPFSGSVEMIKESFKNPKGTIIGLIIVGVVDLGFWIRDGILSGDGFYISELLVEIGSDFTKGIAATIGACILVAASVLVAGAIGVTALPVVVIVGATIVFSFAIGVGLDILDSHLGVTETIKHASKETEKTLRESYSMQFVEPIKDAMKSLEDAFNAYLLKSYLQQLGVR